MHRFHRAARACLVNVALVAVVGGLVWRPATQAAAPAAAQSLVPGQHLTIPLLANATRPADLDYQAGECDIDKSATSMACRFQQVFLTVSPFDRGICLITTNRYEQTFKKESETRWTSREGPEGPCGVVGVATLIDGGGVKWTLETRKVVTNRTRVPACRNMEETLETLSWQNLKRPLPCTSVQPGAISP